MSKNWPALIIGLVVSMYWSRVMLMVRRFRKTAGHDANLVPREQTGRMVRWIWMPVVVLWVALPFMAFFARGGRATGPWVVPATHFPLWMGWAAAFIAVLCLLATLECWRRMGTSWRMGINPDDKTQLIFSGPFAFVRHPIYGLSSLLMIATMLAVPSAIMFTVGIVHVALLQWEARREEQHLIALHGEEYLRYARKTGRFFPRSFRAYQGSGTAG